MSKDPRWMRGWPIVAALALVLALQLFGQVFSVTELPYSEFLQEVARHNVAEVVVSPDRIEGHLAQPPAGGHDRFVTYRVDAPLAQQLQAGDVHFTGAAQGGWLSALFSWVMPALVFVGVWLLVMRASGRKDGLGGFGGGLLSIGRSRAKVFGETDIKVNFDDVAGVDEAKAELQEVVDFLKAPQAHSRLGARMPKGILLVGPPGTGKTLLARAVAGQAGVPFFSINGSEFVEMFVGVGAARVRDLFEQARGHAPAIVFIDEIDALGRARGASALGGQDEKEQTLNQLLAEMDGFDSRLGVVVLAATNRPEILDAALLRAGRFDRQVVLDRPDRRGRVEILQVHLQRVHGSPQLDADAIAALTPGFTGADLANLVNEAALAATRRNADDVAMQDFTTSVERVVAGLEKRNRIMNAQERRAIAVHEMGHALVAMALPGTDKVHKVSIIPRGIGALGFTMQRPTEDRFLLTRSELEDRMAVLLGGRAAESILLAEVSTGAEDDLARATDLARAMVMRFGMDDKLGNVTYERAPSPLLPVSAELGVPQVRQYSDQTGRDIDIGIRRLADAAFQRASDILLGRKALLRQSSDLLLTRESLEGDELAAIARAACAPQPAATVAAEAAATLGR
ncbi:MAG TPA: ATP-dependent zinc metalloprotease FtsH [Ramlibacter sp.]